MDFPSTTAATDDGGVASIAAVHPEVIRTHILTRLDVPTLAAASSSSSFLHSLISSDEKLWRDICGATWPSTVHPRLLLHISAFPSGHRSFFSDSFPLLLLNREKTDLHRSRPLSRLISAVDIHCQGDLVLSKVIETETGSSGWFGSSPFRIDLLEGNHSAVIPIPEKLGTANSACWRQLEQNLTVSWIAIDPTRNSAANFSSRRAVSAQPRRRWVASSVNSRDDDVEMRYSTVVGGGGERGTTAEMVELAVVVTCGVEGGGEVHVKEVGSRVEDMEGRILSGKESMLILGEAIGRRDRRRRRRRRMGGKKEEEEERGMYYYDYEEYVWKRREMRERRERKERVIDIACMAVGISIFFSLWCFLLFRG